MGKYLAAPAVDPEAERSASFGLLHEEVDEAVRHVGQAWPVRICVYVHMHVYTYIYICMYMDACIYVCLEYGATILV